MRVAINGLGRIGKLILKRGLEQGVNIVAINDLTDPENIAYLLRHDSVYGPYDKRVKVGKGFLRIGFKKIKFFSEKDPEKLPWKKLKVDIVVESTGLFTHREDAEKHLKAGAKKVVLTAVSDNPDITLVLGVNDNKLKKEHKIISNASCTTNCLAPVVKILDEKFGIKKGFMTTVHAYTSTQGLVDVPKKKLHRGRAAGLNIIPTTSGATTATEIVLPNMKGKIDGLAFRVPVAVGSIVDFVAELKKKPSVLQINNSFKKAAKGKLKGILDYTEEEFVSTDIIENPHSSIVVGNHTKVNGNMVKVLSWYDNEYGYSCRMVDLLKRLKGLK